MNEYDENIVAILQRLEKIEVLLERMDRDSRSDETWKAAFTVKWDKLMEEHKKIQEHVKENWERINKLVAAPVETKAHLWDTAKGQTLMLIGVAIGSAIITHLPSIIKLFLGGQP
jgi:hypothetical protein